LFNTKYIYEGNASPIQSTVPNDVGPVLTKEKITIRLNTSDDLRHTIGDLMFNLTPNRDHFQGDSCGGPTDDQQYYRTPFSVEENHGKIKLILRKSTFNMVLWWR